MDPSREPVHAEIVLPGGDLHETLPFFLGQLGFRLESIFPADDPSVAVVSGHGVRVRLQRGANGAPGTLRLACRDRSAFGPGATELIAPNGTRIDLVDADARLPLPPLRPSFVLTPARADAGWKVGRAGMLYRDLVPDRQGGRFIASHILVRDGGPVADYVHFHDVQFQMIYCHRGWARLVYEDQGPPFVLHPGDCVLQPPRIRHRVLECSPGLEVIEIGCPAAHETRVDHDLALPTAVARPERTFGGQRFVRHEADAAPWRPWRLAGFEARDTGIADATGGIASVQIARAVGANAERPCSHDASFLFTMVLRGTTVLAGERLGEHRLAPGDVFVVPAGWPYALARTSTDFELLEVALPAHFATTAHDH